MVRREGLRKAMFTIAKNYLSQNEIKQLNRMVTAYLDFAENMTLRHIPLTMHDWEKRLNGFIEMFDYGILQDAGKASPEIVKLHAETEFENIESFRTDCSCMTLISICWSWKKMRRNNRLKSLKR